MLRFHEAVFPSRYFEVDAVNRAVEPLVYFERGRAAEAFGRSARAREYYARVLQRLDAPVPALEPTARAAEAALTRLLERP